MNRFYLLGLLAIPIVIWILPADFFDEGQSICISVLLLKRECMGCGITRAIQHLMHFEFAKAWEFNKLSYPIFAIFFFVWLKQVFKLFSLIFLKTNELKH